MPINRREEIGDPLDFARTYPQIFGQACGGITEVKPASEILREMVEEAAAVLSNGASLVSRL